MPETERRRSDRRSQWNFVISDEGWQWKVVLPTGTEEQARATYPTLKEAGDDAIQHGFGAWKSAERRAGERRETEH